MNALVLLADGVEELEAVGTIDLLRRAQFEVTTVAVQANLLIRTAHGILLEADTAFARITDEGDAALSSFDVVILPGGMAQAKTLANSNAVGKCLRARAEQNLWIAAICASPAIVLAPLGLLRGKHATCYPGLEKALAKPSADKVVIDAPLITSQGPGTTIPFALAIIQTLLDREAAQRVARDILYSGTDF